MEPKPLPEEYLQQYHSAADRAMRDVEARRRWPDSKWSSPVGPLLLIAEIAALRRALRDLLAADDEVADVANGDVTMAAPIKRLLDARTKARAAITSTGE